MPIDEHRSCDPAQGRLDSLAPALLIGAHVDQLGHERQIDHGVQPRRLGHLDPGLVEAPRNHAGATGQGPLLLQEFSLLGGQWRQVVIADGVLAVAQVARTRIEAGEELGRICLGLTELSRVLRDEQVDGLGACLELHVGGIDGILAPREDIDLALAGIDGVATVGALLLGDLLEPLGVALFVFLGLLEASLGRCVLAPVRRDGHIEQFALGAQAPQLEGSGAFTVDAECLDEGSGRLRLRELVLQVRQSLQRLHLVGLVEHLFVRRVEVGEVLDGVVGLLEGDRLLQDHGLVEGVDPLDLHACLDPGQ